MKTYTTYSVLKYNEGGMGQRMALVRLKQVGIEAKAGHSPYIGHSGVVVYGGKRVQARASKILYGR